LCCKQTYPTAAEPNTEILATSQCVGKTNSPNCLERNHQKGTIFETSKKNSNDQYTGLLHFQIQRKSGKFKKETQNKETIKQ